MSFKTVASSVGNGILDATGSILTSMHNDPRNTRIAEIDAEIVKLQAEKTKLQSELI
jgi:peptidoglycan hydrolase CwlO-like protein